MENKTMSQIYRDALLFEAGTYPDKNVEVSEAQLDRIIANVKSSDAPIKIEHTTSPLDGALGCVSSLVRKGKELWGKIGASAAAWEIIDKAKAWRLSVGIDLENDVLEECSLVRYPRVASARIMCSGSRVIFNAGRLEFGFGGLSVAEIKRQTMLLIDEDPPGEAEEGCYCYVTDTGITEDSLVVSDGWGNYFRYPFTVTNGVLSLGESEQVIENWIPAPAVSEDETNNDETTGGSEMETYSQEQLDAAIASAVQTSETRLTAQFDSKFSELADKLDSIETARRATFAQSTVADLVASGKVPEGPAAEAAQKLLASGGEAAESFLKFAEAIATSASENAQTTDEATQAAIWEQLGITAEDAQKANAA